LDGQEKLAIINCANSIVIIEDFAITAHALVNRMNSVENFASSSYVLTNATITEDVLKKALVIVIKDGKVHFVRDRYVLWMKMVLYVVDMENVILTQKKCKCNDNWTGDICDKLPCPSDCSGNGVCNRGICYCKDGYFGTICN